MEKNIERITKEALIARAQQSKDSKTKYADYYCKPLGAKLTIKKLSVTRMCQIMDMAEGDTMEAGLELNKQMIYESIPLLQDKEIQDAYECAEPYDIVLKVLDDDMGEMQRLCEKILSIYGMNEMGENIKN